MNYVETVLIDNSNDLILQRLDANTPDVIGTRNIIGHLDGAISLPIQLLTLNENPSQTMKTFLPWGCKNCTVSLGGSKFSVTTPANINRHAFNRNTTSTVTTTGQFQTRLVGCVHLVETSGHGIYANKRGYMCGSSSINFDQNLNAVGSSTYQISIGNGLRR
jgi:hypothetical protein